MGVGCRTGEIREPTEVMLKFKVICVRELSGRGCFRRCNNALSSQYYNIQYLDVVVHDESFEETMNKHSVNLHLHATILTSDLDKDMPIATWLSRC